MRDWRHQEMELEVAVPGSKRPYGPGRITGKGLSNSGIALILCALPATRRTRPTSQISTFGLRDGRRNPSHLLTESFDRTFERADDFGTFLLRAGRFFLSAVKPKSNRMVRL